jgi:immune inhibitor A
MMSKALALFVCFSMVVSGLALFATGGNTAMGRGKVNPPGTAFNGGAAAIRQGAGDGPTDLVPPAPWSAAAGRDPYNGLNRSRHPNSSPLAATGSAKVLVVLVDFNDTSNSSTHTPTYYGDLLFNASASSMNEYYQEASFGLFCITGNVTTVWYSMSHSLAYYGTYEFDSPPVAGFGNSQTLTTDAVTAADADIDFSEFDQDGDGYVDHLVIVHAGGDEAATGVSTDIWSHAWALNSNKFKLDGVYINAYTMLSEDDPVGVYIHEFGHNIGLPDLYDTDYSSDGGVGKWDVMASGSWNNYGDTPAMFSAWCRQELGWLSPSLVSADSSGLIAKRIYDNQTAFKVWLNFSNSEYFLVENRQQVGWDAYIPGNGLLIWHVNETATSNDYDKYRMVNLEQWDNNNKASNANDPWRSNSTGFTPTSAPNTSDDSGRNSGIWIFNISASGDTMYFDVDLGNAAPAAPVPSAPADGNWSNNARPVLNWTFSDPDSGDGQTAYRVQVDGDSSFGSVDWDSGVVYATSGTCTVGMALGEGTWYWRVETRDTGGLWGPFNSATVRSFGIDLTAPATPTAVTLTPGGWTATNSFSVGWTYPTESGTSGIATGAYYKLDAAPSSATDGTFVGSEPMTGIQVSGSGNHTIYLWLVDNVGNVNGSNRATATLQFDNAAPANPNSLTSPTHAVSAWSNLSVIQAQWAGASDQDSGVDGYSFLWDGNANTVPDAVMDCMAAVSANTSLPLADGTYYFHIRTVDKVGNWAAGAAHLGPFFIDLTPAGGVSGVSSMSHILGQWSNNSDVTVQWWGASDGGSGVGGYSFVWDTNAGTVPDNITDLTGGTSVTVSFPSADGQGYYFHIRVRDDVGNWNSTAFHLGPFDIDTVPPSDPGSFLVLSNSTIGVWGGNRVVTVSWSGFADAMSGVDGFAILWDHFATTSPGYVKDLEEDQPFAASRALPTGQYYLHLRTRDNAGNWNDSAIHIGPFLIDADRPSAVAARSSGPFSGSPVLEWSWSDASDPLSGVEGYVVSVGFVPGGSEVVREAWTTQTSFTISDAQDGKTYYCRVRAVDRAGNPGAWGPSSGGVLVDLTPPQRLSIQLDGNSPATNSPDLQVSLNATDFLSGVAEMRFCQDDGNWTAWVPFRDQHEVNLTARDGLRTVSYQARDAVGNEAPAVSGSILLDTAGPSITVLEKAGGDRPTNGSHVGVRLKAQDALSAVYEVRLGPDGSSWGPWEAYGQLLAWDLTGPDGSRTVYAQAMDAAGNIGPAAKLTIVRDTTAPGKPIVSSGTHPRGDTWYNSAELSLNWTAPADGTGIAGYAFIITPDAKDRPGFTIQMTGTSLEMAVPGDGRWHFMLRAMDGAGNWGDSADYILLIDTSGPSAPAPDQPADGTDFLPTTPIAFTWSGASDGLSGVKGFCVQVAADAGFESPAFEGLVDGNGYTVDSLPDGSYYWHVRARDSAGNWGEYGQASAFNVHKAVKPIAPSQGPGFVSLSNPVFVVLLGVILLAVIAGGAAAAVRRRRMRPPLQPAGAPQAGGTVSWE